MENTDRFSELFDSYYYAHDCNFPYLHNAHWLNFFDGIAARIIEDFHPRTVLDAGCAWGFLVECLRNRGVDAWGVDISEYAIEHVQPEIRPYCQVGSLSEPLPEPLPKQFDLVVTIEVLEHMPEDIGKRAVEMLCGVTKDVLCSASHQDFKEATHLNVQMPAYWVQQFARHGFFRDIDFDGSFITPWTMRFRKNADPLHEVVKDYEQRMWRLNSESAELHKANLELHGRLQELSSQLEQARAQAVTPPAPQEDPRVVELQGRLQTAEGELAGWNARWADMQRGAGWRALEMLRKTRVRLVPPGSRREAWLYAIIHPGRSR
jgi:hypothetical protein